MLLAVAQLHRKGYINRDDAYDGIRRIAAFPAGSELVRDDARLKGSSSLRASAI
jgi:hypothetical protein